MSSSVGCGTPVWAENCKQNTNPIGPEGKIKAIRSTHVFVFALGLCITGSHLKLHIRPEQQGHPSTRKHSLRSSQDSRLGKTQHLEHSQPPNYILLQHGRPRFSHLPTFKRLFLVLRTRLMSLPTCSGIVVPLSVHHALTLIMRWREVCLSHCLQAQDIALSLRHQALIKSCLGQVQTRGQWLPGPFSAPKESFAPMPLSSKANYRWYSSLPDFHHPQSQNVKLAIQSPGNRNSVCK